MPVGVRQSGGRTRTPRAFYGLVAGVVAVAFAVRLLYLIQIETIPFFYDLEGDGKAYWEWAGGIAGGDWFGSVPFYQAPAYPYFLAVLRVVVGDDLWRVHVAQAALGSIACGLVALAGRMFASPRAGLCAGALMALYAPAIFFDGLIQKATLSLFLMALLLCLLGLMTRRAVERRRMQIVPALGTGVVLGLLALTREQALLLGGVILLWLLLGGAGRRLPAAAFVAGVATVLGLVGWRNYRVGGEVVLTTNAGPNFYIGNHEGATGRYVALRPGAEWPPLEQQAATELAEAETGRSLTPGEVSRFWLGKSWDYIRHRPLAWIGLLVHKWTMVWNAYELSDTESFTLYAHLSWLLGTCGTVNHFGVLWPLAAVGLAATLRRWRSLWLLYAMILALAGGVALFFVFARYRYALVPLLVIFAGPGVVEIARLFRGFAGRRTKSQTVRLAGTPAPPERDLHPWVTVLVVVVVAVGSNVRLEHQHLLDGTSYENWGVVMGEKGDYALAVHLLSEALRHRPNSPDVYTNLGATLAAEGRIGEAVPHYLEALRLAPESAKAHYHLGRALAVTGRSDEAVAHFHEAVRIDGDFARARFQLGLLHAGRGRFDEAIRSYREVLRIDPGSAAAHYNIGALLDQQGCTDEAIAEYREALAIDSGHTKARTALDAAQAGP